MTLSPSKTSIRTLTALTPAAQAAFHGSYRMVTLALGPSALGMMTFGDGPRGSPSDPSTSLHRPSRFPSSAAFTEYGLRETFWTENSMREPCAYLLRRPSVRTWHPVEHCSMVSPASTPPQRSEVRRMKD